MDRLIKIILENFTFALAFVVWFSLYRKTRNHSDNHITPYASSIRSNNQHVRPGIGDAFLWSRVIIQSEENKNEIALQPSLTSYFSGVIADVLISGNNTMQWIEDGFDQTSTTPQIKLFTNIYTGKRTAQWYMHRFGNLVASFTIEYRLVNRLFRPDGEGTDFLIAINEAMKMTEMSQRELGKNIGSCNEVFMSRLKIKIKQWMEDVKITGVDVKLLLAEQPDFSDEGLKVALIHTMTEVTQFDPSHQPMATKIACALLNARERMMSN